MALIESQIVALAMACTAGEPHGLCQMTQVVIMQESSACLPTQKIGDDNTSFGCGGFKLDTAREFDKKATIKRLVMDDKYNIRLTVRSLMRCKARHKEWERQFVCHNSPYDAQRMSMAEIRKHPYLSVVRKRIGELAPIQGRVRMEMFRQRQEALKRAKRK